MVDFRACLHYDARMTLLNTLHFTAAVLSCAAGGAALAQAAWLPQRAMTGMHGFEVQAREQRGSFTVHAIRVIERKSGKLVQEFAVEDAERDGEAGDLLQLVDANRDGHLDIAMQVATGGSSAMSMRHYYLFDPAGGAFAFHPGLSNLVNATFFENGTVVTSYNRTGFAGGETWRWRHGKLQRIAYGELAVSVNGRWETSKECKLPGARMRCITTRKRLAAQ